AAGFMDGESRLPVHPGLAAPAQSRRGGSFGWLCRLRRLAVGSGEHAFLSGFLGCRALVHPALETRGRRLTRGTRRGGKTGVTVLRTVTRMTTGVAGELIRGPFRSGGQEGRPAGRRAVVAAGNGFVGSIVPAQKPRPLCPLRCSDLRQPALAAV